MRYDVESFGTIPAFLVLGNNGVFSFASSPCVNARPIHILSNDVGNRISQGLLNGFPYMVSHESTNVSRPT